MSTLAYGAAALVATAGVLVTAYVAPYAIKSRQKQKLRALCRRQRCLVLTYDDGPSGEITPALLDLLSSYRACATFFLLGKYAVVHPAVADRIVADGHEVGCHSARHLHAWTSLPWKVTRDMAEGYRELAPWIRPDGPYRPPYGKPYLPLLWGLTRRRARLGWWTIDSGDASATRPPIENTLAAVRSEGGGVVLMHDRAKDIDLHRRYVLEVTERLLRLARDEGISVKRLSDLFARR